MSIEVPEGRVLLNRLVVLDHHRGEYTVSLDGVPSAGDACLASGVPTVSVRLGEALEIRATDLEWLDEFESAIRVARARLSMWGDDHKSKDA